MLLGSWVWSSGGIRPQRMPVRQSRCVGVHVQRLPRQSEGAVAARGAYAGVLMYCLDFSPYSVDFHTLKRVYETPSSAYTGCS